MLRRIGGLAVALLLASLIATALEAQEASSSVLSSSEISDLVTGHAADLAQRRSAVKAFLDRGEVRRTAESAGIDIRRVESAAATLSEEDLDRLEPRLMEAEAALAGEGLISFLIGAAVLTILILVIIELV